METILPWVKSGKYLGSKMTNIMDGFSQDTRIKRAQYIERNCDNLQDFAFAHPQLKSKINRIYNSTFSGSVLWDLSPGMSRCWKTPVQSLSDSCGTCPIMLTDILWNHWVAGTLEACYLEDIFPSSTQLRNPPN